MLLDIQNCQVSMLCKLHSILFHFVSLKIVSPSGSPTAKRSRYDANGLNSIKVGTSCLPVGIEAPALAALENAKALLPSIPEELSSLVDVLHETVARWHKVRVITASCITQIAFQCIWCVFYCRTAASLSWSHGKVALTNHDNQLKQQSEMRMSKFWR